MAIDRELVVGKRDSILLSFFFLLVTAVSQHAAGGYGTSMGSPSRPW